VSNRSGTLYVVATPIGNLEDMSARAIRVLGEADLVLAEDTRHTGKLLQHFGIKAEMRALHEHNEKGELPEHLRLLQSGHSLALVSDAGTPLVSDPGFPLVRAAREAGIHVVPVPGSCAAIAALSASGMPCGRFVFEGFPPGKSVARRAHFEALAHESRTLIFYESPHRIVESLTDMAAVFGPTRAAVLARELTKQFETIESATFGELLKSLHDKPDTVRGEFVVLVAGERVNADDVAADIETQRVLKILVEELPVSQAAAVAARLLNAKKNTLYELALEMAKVKEQ
jgi:16S rRNA (cytidine1402-2'-O)-methyltransferase